MNLGNGGIASGSFDAIFRSAADVIVTANGEGTVVAWNPVAAAMFGYHEDEILGQPLTMLVPERFRAAHSAGFDRGPHHG